MIATSAPLWGHDSREAVAARLFDHIDSLLDGPETRGFPKGRPRRCRVYVARIKKARELLAEQTVIDKTDALSLLIRVQWVEEAARAGGWL